MKTSQFFFWFCFFGILFLMISLTIFHLSDFRGVQRKRKRFLIEIYIFNKRSSGPQIMRLDQFPPNMLCTKYSGLRDSVVGSVPSGESVD
jgi:hypothetical protein